MANKIFLPYASFKVLIQGKRIGWQYVERENRYDIYFAEPDFTYLTAIYKTGFSGPGTDPVVEQQNQDDFESNFKENANRAASILQSGSDIIFEPDSYTTTNASANARPNKGDMLVKRMKSKTLYIENLGSNGASISVIGNFSNISGNENTIAIITGQSLAAGQGLQVDEDRPFESIRVLARSGLPGFSTTIRTRGYALGN